jgi:putative iron-only hydrogenase system regulator
MHCYFAPLKARFFIQLRKGIFMESRVALIGIIVENRESAESLNSLLHQYAEYIIGRMGLPYPKHGISIISICMDAPGDVISSLSGKLGMLPGVNIKTIYSKAVSGSKEVKEDA